MITPKQIAEAMTDPFLELMRIESDRVDQPDVEWEKPTLNLRESREGQQPPRDPKKGWY